MDLRKFLKQPTLQYLLDYRLRKQIDHIRGYGKVCINLVHFYSFVIAIAHHQHGFQLYYKLESKSKSIHTALQYFTAFSKELLSLRLLVIVA